MSPAGPSAASEAPVRAAEPTDPAPRTPTFDDVPRAVLLGTHVALRMVARTSS